MVVNQNSSVVWEKGARLFWFATRIISGEHLEPFAIVPGVPFSGFGYAVLEEGLAEEVMRIFNLFRLHGIKQLGYLRDPVVRDVAWEGGIGMTFNHTRYAHSLHVMAVAMLIA